MEISYRKQTTATRKIQCYIGLNFLVMSNALVAGRVMLILVLLDIFIYVSRMSHQFCRRMH